MTVKGQVDRVGRVGMVRWNVFVMVLAILGCLIHSKKATGIELCGRQWAGKTGTRWRQQCQGGHTL